MSLETLGFIALTVTVAYGVFGMTGFGAAMIAVPVLVQSLPLQFAVPMVVLLDLACTAVVGGRHWRLVACDEMLRLLPALLAGVAIGTLTLAGIGSKWPLVVLGLFVLAVAGYSMRPARGQTKAISGWWAAPVGVIGGIFSALFGTGGPIYTVYLAGRLFEPERFRATISVVILASGLTRAISFATAGLYAQPSILASAFGVLPFSLLGVYLGSRLRHKLSAAAKRRAVLVLLLGGGLGAIYRGLTMSP